MGAAPSLFPLLVILAIAAGPAALFWWGWRWRRETIPPTCRRCGYDVSQRLAGVERCSECGADLTTRDATTTIRRRPDWWIAGPSALLLVAALAVLAAALATFPWTQWFYATAPISWVARLAEKNRGPAGDVARSAWMARDGGSSQFIDHLLDLQGDLKVPWTGRWGDVLIDHFRFDRLTDAQKQRFIRQLFGPATFRARTPVRQGDPLIVSASWPKRGGIVNRLPIRSLLVATAAGPAGVDDRRLHSLGQYGYSGIELRIIPSKHWGGEELATGRHKVSIAIASAVNSFTPLIEHSGEVEIEVLPRGAPLGEPIIDPSRADEIARAVNVKVSHWHDGRAFAEVRLFPAGVDRAFTVFAVIDGQEKPIGSVAAMAGQWATSNAIYIPVSVERANAMDRLTIILVGDGEVLKETLEQTGYWSGRIVYPDVALGTFKEHYETGRPRPTTWPYRLEQRASPPSIERNAATDER